MNQYWNNLRPLEKRLVLAVGSALFVVLNLWLVVPHFGDWSLTGIQLEKARKKLNDYNTEIAKMDYYKREIAKYQGEALDVAQEDQANRFNVTITSLLAENGIVPGTSSRLKWDTNQFFLELSQTITIAAREQPLVNYLFQLGSRPDSLIRVRGLTLNPDPPHQQLMASITMAASYQRKQPAKGTAPAAPAPGSAPKTNVPVSKKAEPPKVPPPAQKSPGKPPTSTKK